MLSCGAIGCRANQRGLGYSLSNFYVVAPGPSPKTKKTMCHDSNFFKLQCQGVQKKNWHCVTAYCHNLVFQTPYFSLFLLTAPFNLIPFHSQDILPLFQPLPTLSPSPKHLDLHLFHGFGVAFITFNAHHPLATAHSVSSIFSNELKA